MGEAEAAASAGGGKKTVQVDLASLSSTSKAGSRRARSRSGTGRSSESAAASKVDIATKSAELQAAVEQALAAAGRPGRPDAPPPPRATATATNPAATQSSGTKRISSDLLGESIPASHPRSTNSVATAVQELNQLMQQRLQARMRKTMRAGARRGRLHEQQRAEPSVTEARPGTPLVSNSTAARIPNDPPWGCLKGGDKQTWREYKHHTTMRAARKPSFAPVTTADTPAPSAAPPAVAPQANATAPATPAPTPARSTAAAPTPAPRTTSSTSPLAESAASEGSETVTVGRQKDGRVAFVVGNRGHQTRRDRAAPVHRSVTNRAKLRKARLTRGGSQTPQRLIDAIADSVDAIGSVVNVHARSAAS